MFNRIESEVWAFDVEWVPDVETCRNALADGFSSDEEVVEAMWAEERRRSKSSEERPFLPLPLCQVVAIAAVVRRQERGEEPKLSIRSLPQGDCTSEKAIVDRFLNGVESRKPQLVGWSSSGSDIHILMHRAMRYGHHLSYPGLLPPDKPWEGRDYFSGKSSCHVDLMNDLFGWGRKSSLNDMAACVGVPGKLGVAGEDVYDLWRAGRIAEIRGYCECDALTTYLIWLRAAHFVGLIEDLAAEEQAVRDLILSSTDEDDGHLARYLAAWATEAPGLSVGRSLIESGKGPE